VVWSGMSFEVSTTTLIAGYRGMETETNFFLGLGVPELDQGMEIIIFG
jgi:hypothetical protein